MKGILLRNADKNTHGDENIISGFVNYLKVTANIGFMLDDLTCRQCVVVITIGRIIREYTIENICFLNLTKILPLNPYIYNY